MARALVTQEAVTVAAEQLLAAGEEPSIINVQAAVGGGSYTTVKRFLDVWRAQRVVQPAIEVPPDIEAQARELARRVWAAAAALAEQQLDQVRGEAAQQVTEARTALALAEAEIARQETEAEIQTRQREELRTALQQAQQATEAARSTEQVAETRADTLAQQLSDFRRQLDAARGTTDAVQGQLREQARQLGELDALRRQVQEQLGLIERLGGNGAAPPRAAQR